MLPPANGWPSCSAAIRASGSRAIAQPTPASGIDGADRLAHHQLLGVGLGEFVAIMAADPRASRGSSSGRTGSWIDAGAVDQPVEQAELERVDDILGIVEHDRLGRPARLQSRTRSARRKGG